jgi:hypothetical protein
MIESLQLSQLLKRHQIPNLSLHSAAHSYTDLDNLQGARKQHIVGNVESADGVLMAFKCLHQL